MSFIIIIHVEMNTHEYNNVNLPIMLLIYILQIQTIESFAKFFHNVEKLSAYSSRLIHEIVGLTSL